MTLLLPAKSHQNCQVDFGCCEQQWFDTISAVSQHHGQIIRSISNQEQNDMKMTTENNSTTRNFKKNSYHWGARVHLCYVFPLIERGHCSSSEHRMQAGLFFIRSPAIYNAHISAVPGHSNPWSYTVYNGKQVILLVG